MENQEEEKNPPLFLFSVHESWELERWRSGRAWQRGWKWHSCSSQAGPQLSCNLPAKRHHAGSFTLQQPLGMSHCLSHSKVPLGGQAELEHQAPASHSFPSVHWQEWGATDFGGINLNYLLHNRIVRHLQANRWSSGFTGWVTRHRSPNQVNLHTAKPHT